MRSIVFKLVLFTLAVYLPWMAVVKFGREYYLSNDFASWKYKFSLAAEPKEKFNPEHIALGDCLLLVGLRPEKVDPRLYNLGMSGATPIEAYFLLRRYLESGKKPKRTYLMFGLTHFQVSDAYREYTLGFRELTFSEEMELFNDIRTYGSPEGPQVSWQKTWVNNLLTMSGLDPEIQVQVRHRLFTSSHEEINELYRKMEETRGQHFFPDDLEQTLQPSPHVDYEKLSLNRVIDHYLKKTLTLLRENKIETIVDFVPNNEVSTQKFSPVLLSEWQEYRKKLKTNFPEIIIGDMSHYPPELFSDHSHLNREGARKFSLEFKARYYQFSGQTKTAAQ